jgi:hypothetical protein
MREVWGCNGKTKMHRPTMVDEENGIRTLFWSCPVRFIPSSVLSFIAEHRFYQSHPSAPFPKREHVSPKYAAAEIIYESALREYSQEK